MTENAIDPNALSSLLDSIGGDKDFLAELIETFFQDAPAQFAVLHTSLQDGNAEAIRRAAHSLKSNAASFGAKSLAAKCKALEHLGKEDRLFDAADLLAESEKEYARVQTELEAKLDETGR
jgi:HPt (histidine-containing phosphotransfer) domain-containing protein